MTMVKRSYGAYSITSYHLPFSCTISIVSITLPWCKVEPIQNSAVTFLLYSFSLSYEWRSRNCLTAKVVPSLARFMIRTEPPAPEPSTLPNLPYFDSKPWSSAKGRAMALPLEGGVCVPVPLEGGGDLSRFSFLCEPPILKNRLRSDIELCFSCL